MPKRRDSVINKSDIEAYVAQTSDFGFEMLVLRQLSQIGFSCDHAGTYRDPVTDKIRNYDFRARRQVVHNKYLYLAVECKNIRPSSPLLVHATPRTEGESFHSLLVRERAGFYDITSVQTVNGRNSIYPPEEPVGRDTDQVSRNQSGEFVGGDTIVFEKLLQALHSTQGLVQETTQSTYCGPVVTVIVPVVVIPDGLLWQIDYGASGEPTQTLRQVVRTTLLCRHVWVVTMPLNIVSYTVSHLEIITFGGLTDRLNQLIGDKGVFAKTED